MDPRLFGRKLEGLVLVNWSDEQRESFEERRTSLNFRALRRRGKHTYLAGYRIEDVTLDEVELIPIDSRVEDVQLGSLNGGWIRDVLNDPINPRKGTLYTSDLQWFARVLGSEQAFVKYFGKASLFLPMTRRTVWAQGLRVGVQKPYNDSVIPLSEGFFAGGHTTIRGFPVDGVGPKDPITGNPTGGEGLIIVNEEFWFPILGKLEGITFLDFGNVYPSVQDINLTKMRWVLGVGVRYPTPVGVFRLEYGHKLDRRDGESAGEVFFSIGHPF